MTSYMRSILDSMPAAQPASLSTDIDEGIIDSIRNWISKLSDPVKRAGAEHLRDLESRLKTKYGAKVPQQVKTANKQWMWSKITYKDLFNFVTQVLDKTPEDLDSALKNKIVMNNLRHVVNALPDGTEAPPLPLTARVMQNNSSIISPTIDPQTKQYLSRAITIAIIDVMAYLDQQNADAAAAQAKKAAATPSAAPAASATTPADTGGTAAAAPPAAPKAPTSPDDIKAAIDAIKKGLAAMKGSAT